MQKSYVEFAVLALAVVVVATLSTILGKELADVIMWALGGWKIGSWVRPTTDWLWQRYNNG
jgi:hypothetical protein